MPNRNKLSYPPYPLRRCLGQGMTEYIIIVALIAVAAIGVYSLLGKTVRGQVAGIASEITGQSSTNQLNSARSAARRANTLGRQDVSLGNYDEVTESGN
ncbi:Flp family type IVb pilin [Pseudidiomarina andamanensis]|uniref:Pilus assembly protein n=1 Tax=Pseudidiomarina andamanensis TaxID=1940690 RepID=A0AA92ET65_9GAMM|nr:pilus assembly protein [Pseudidiomarina andamanensis]MDS0219683.1 pilus assembly protein [Pseudidiomarina andamanensis]QGT95696.1 pilus assembly protein [Pseudidiomarina andamanensis]